MKTIIDTNIMYSFVRRLNEISDNNIINPVVNILNIDELSRSTNFVYNLELIRKAIQLSMNVCKRQIIPENPFMYLLKLDGQLDVKLTEHDAFLLNLTQNLAQGLVVDDESMNDHLENYINPRKLELEGIANTYNQITKRIRENEELPKSILTLKHLIPFAIQRLQEDISSWSKANLGLELELSDSFDYQQIELYLTCFAVFYKSMLNSSGKWKENDAYDLYQLIYIHPGDKYWTKEKKWQNIINNQAKMPMYLVEYNRAFL